MASKIFCVYGQRELFVVVAIQFTGPRIEQLYDLSAGLDLKQQVGADGVCKLIQQLVQHSAVRGKPDL